MRLRRQSEIVNATAMQTDTKMV